MERSLDRSRLEFNYYADLFDYAHLSVAKDGQWLKSVAKTDFDDNWLSYINTKTIGIGSAELDYAGADLHPAILRARQEFFGDTLGWGDETHPLYDVYSNFESRYPDLEAPATMITIFRRLDEHGIDVAEKLAQVPKLLTVSKRLFDNTEPDDAVKRTQQLHNAVDTILSQPIPVKTAPKPSPRKTSADKHTSKGRVVMMPSESLIAERTPHLLEVGFAQEVIDKNAWSLIRHSSADIDKFLKLFANYGLDGVAMMSGHLQGLEKVETAEQRLIAMQAMGLHVPSVLEGYGDALCIKSELISEKMPVINRFLDAVNSDIPITRAINERPKMLARSATKFLAVAGVLEGSTDTAGMHIRYVEPFARNSLDLTFAALVRRRQDGKMVYATDLDKTARLVAADHRRNFNLDAIQDVSVRSLLTAHAIRSYLIAAPLTEKESANYPEVADLMQIQEL